MARVKHDYADAFSAALAEQLTRRSLRQTDLAKARGVSPAYINRLANGGSVTPESADMIADAMNATDEDRRKLHVAAARARGYRI
jgi:transcriptional regulator with XRE-family HTH domain